MGKKVYIVFEETGEGGGKGFNMYLEGMSIEANRMTSKEQMDKLSPAEFWALSMFRVCTGVMGETGVIHSIKEK